MECWRIAKKYPAFDHSSIPPVLQHSDIRFKCNVLKFVDKTFKMEVYSIVSPASRMPGLTPNFQNLMLDIEITSLWQKPTPILV